MAIEAISNLKPINDTIIPIEPINSEPKSLRRINTEALNIAAANKAHEGFKTNPFGSAEALEAILCFSNAKEVYGDSLNPVTAHLNPFDEKNFGLNGYCNSNVESRHRSVEGSRTFYVCG